MNTFTYPPGPERDKEVAHVTAWVDHAVEMGAPVIRIFAGDVQKGTTEEQARRWGIDAIQQCCEYAGQRGVILALENHGGIVSTAQQLLSIVREVKSEWFGVNWDSGNFRRPVRRAGPGRALRGDRPDQDPGRLAAGATRGGPAPG